MLKRQADSRREETMKLWHSLMATGPTQDCMRRRYTQVAKALYYFCSEISFDQACETKQKPLLYILAYILPEQGKWKEFILLVLEKWAVASLLHVICAWSISEWVVARVCVVGVNVCLHPCRYLPICVHNSQCGDSKQGHWGRRNDTLQAFIAFSGADICPGGSIHNLHRMWTRTQG